MTAGWKLGTAVAFLVLTGGGTRAGAETLQLHPSKDNTLYQDPAGGLSNGQGENFFAGRTSAGLIRRGLIAFDVACSVPAGSTIQRVMLTVHMSRGLGPEVEIDLVPVLQDWGEGASVAKGMEGAGAPAEPGDATWLHTFSDSQFWNTVGGDFASTVSGNAAISEVSFYTFDSLFNPGMLDDVQQWLDRPATDFGWGVRASDEFFPMSAKRFDSRENSNPDFRPVLTIIFLPAGASR